MKLGLLIQDLTEEEIKQVLERVQEFKTKPFKDRARYCKLCKKEYSLDSLNWNEFINGYKCLDC